MKKITAIGFALLMIFAVFVPMVSAINDPTKEGYQSQVNPNPAGDGGAAPTSGMLTVNLLCRSPQIGGEFSIAPVTVSKPFTNGARVPVDFINEYVKYMGPVTVEQFLPDGTFDTQVPFGTYVLAMKDGNGGQPEYALVTILKNQANQIVSFQGHGITPADVPKEKYNEFKVCLATYGVIYLIEPAHAGYFETVVTQEAYDEQVLVTAAYCDAPVHHDAVMGTETYEVTPAVAAYYEHPNGDTVVDVAGHYQHPNGDVIAAVYRQGTPCSSSAQGHVHANQVSGNAGATNRFVSGGHVYQETGNSHDATFLVTGTYVAEHTVSCTHFVDTTYKTVTCVHYHAEVPAVMGTRPIVITPAYDDPAVCHDAVYQTVHHAAKTHKVFHPPTLPKFGGKFIDVTDIVQGQVAKGELHIAADYPNLGYNALFGDPVVGHLKKLIVVYSVNGKFGTKTVNEDEDLNIV